MTTETAKLYENINITKLENSEIEIEGEIPVSVIPTYRTKAIKKLSKNIKIDGFRKGHIPEKVLVEKIGEDGLLGEVAELALADMYPTLVTDENLKVIGTPQVTLTKLTPGNPIGFKIKSAVFPEFDLPDYKKIANGISDDKDADIEVTGADVDKVLTEVRRGKARFDKAKEHDSLRNITSKDGSSSQDIISDTLQGIMSGDQDQDVKQETTDSENPEAKTEGSNEEDLPELDDVFIATLGDFKTVADFEARVREDLVKEKTHKAQERKRIKLSEELIEKTDIKVPIILVSSELDKMVAQMKDDVARMNMKFEDYLTQTKKTVEDLRDEWKDQARKRATLQLLLNKIAEKESITPDEDKVRHEMEHILEHHKDANSDNVRIYVETQLVNEDVFRFLEGDKKDDTVEKK